MNITRHPDGSVTVTLSAGEATDLTDELLWVKNVDEDGPVRALWTGLDGIQPDREAIEDREREARDSRRSGRYR